MMRVAAQLATSRIGFNKRMSAAFVQREPLAISALVAGFAVLGIHVCASRIGLSNQLTQDLTNLADPTALILLVLYTRKAVTPVAAPRHKDGRRLIPAE